MRVVGFGLQYMPELGVGAAAKNLPPPFGISGRSSKTLLNIMALGVRFRIAILSHQVSLRSVVPAREFASCPFLMRLNGIFSSFLFPNCFLTKTLTILPLERAITTI